MRHPDGMMRSIPLISAAAFVLGAASPSVAAPLEAKPKWVINYADSFCLLSRDRSPTESGVAIRTRPFAEEHELLLMMEPSSERRLNGQGQVIVGNFTVGPERWVAAAASKQADVRLLETTIKVAEFSAAVAAGKIRILVPGKLDARIQLPNIAKAAAAMKDCEDDLARRWKITRNWAVDPKPIPDSRGPFRHDDYPQQMIVKERIGAILALLGIDEAGKVTDCRIIERSGDPLFEEVVCTVFRKRARYKPALGSNGQPIASYHLAPRVRFHLE